MFEYGDQAEAYWKLVFVAEPENSQHWYAGRLAWLEVEDSDFGMAELAADQLAGQL